MSFVFMSLILWLAGAQGRGQAQRPPQQPVWKEIVAGTVTRAETLRPFARVRVELRREDYGTRLNTQESSCAPLRNLDDPDRRRFVLTDTLGRFAFENVMPGRYYVVAEHEGYLRAEFGQRGGLFSRGAILAVGPQVDTGSSGMPLEALKDLRLSLSPAPNVVGRIHGDQTGRVPAAIVQLYQHRFTAMNGRTLVPVRSIFTDDNGEYRMFWLNPGQYVVSAAYSDYVFQPWTTGIRFSPNLPDSDNRYPVVFFPGTVKSSEAISVSVGTVVAPPMDVLLWERPRHTVEINLTGAPNPGNITVVLVPFGGDVCTARDFGFAPRRADGIVEIRDVPQGLYTVMAVRGRESWSEMLPLPVDQHIRGFQIPLVQPVDIPVRDLPATLSGYETRIHLTRIDNDAKLVQSFGPDAKGKFLLKGIGPGSYYITVDTPHGQYVSRVSAFRWIPENPIEPCDPPPTGTPRRISSDKFAYLDSHGHLSREKPFMVPQVIPGDMPCLSISVGTGGQLLGRVVDRAGIPVAGALVAGLPSSVWGAPDRRDAFTPPDRYLSTSTDGEGYFVLSGAVSGTEYKLLAFEDLDPSFLFDPGLADRFSTRDLIEVEEREDPQPAPRGQRRGQPQTLGQARAMRSVLFGPGSLCSGSSLCILKVIPSDETLSLR
jgi:hypothetical protein